MSYKQFSIVVLLLLCTLRCMAVVNHDEQWKKANAFYEQKQYDSAAFYYEQITALKPKNAEVYYNLGNTYYRLNKIPMAVLNYERALEIDPDYTQARDNLSITQGRIGNHIPKANDIFFITWWQSVSSARNATGWSAGALCAFVLIIVSLWVRRFMKKGNRLPVQVTGILIFVCLCLLTLAFISAGNSEKATGAVVMEHDSPLMNDQQKGKPLALVPEGTTVKILDEKGMWVEVSLPDGRNGWLLQNQITKI